MQATAPPNRLAREASPYLRQHAHDPVDWYPWGTEALSRARQEDRPIFLSIGYSACHWCHVMARESFADPEVARRLNEAFVCIKVDREERPDLDAIYMAAVQALTGSGGWPLSVFLTPEGQAFFGGTYFPPERRWGRPSFREVVEGVARAWREQRGHLEAGARQLLRQLAAFQRGGRPGALDAATAEAEALRRLAGHFDPQFGGFGQAPKFPSPSRLFLLLDLAADPAARTMLGATLDGMAAGGMWDWVGGGFHRYAVDRQWLVPHFEKMLYDNALLARLYGEAGVRLDNPRWLAVATATADYLLREMQGPDGGFFASTDADSAGAEGLYFTWTAAEVRDALPPELADTLVRLCGLDGPPNFEDGRSVLRPRQPHDPSDPLLAEIRARLLQARSRRPPPALDDKRLAGWNGMAIWALAWLGVALDAPRFLAAARAASEFVRRELLPEGGLIVRSFRDGVRSGRETLEDLAWLLAGFAELYETTGDAVALATAAALVERRLPHYLDPAGGVFDTPDDGEPLVLRPRDLTDGATPAPAGILAATLARLAALLHRPEWSDAAARIVAAAGELVAQVPDSCASLLSAARLASEPLATVAIVGEPHWPSTVALHRVAVRHRRRRVAVALAPCEAAAGVAAPLFAGRHPAGDGRAAAWVCQGAACLPPIEDGGKLLEVIAGL